jgi:4-alpha-glucanotransferase
MTARHAGLLLPLFSASSSSSWGIGELPDAAVLGEWLEAAGLDRLMLLPLGTVPDGETSPYSAASAMAIDPIYIAIAEMEDFTRAGGAATLSLELREHLDAAVGAPAVSYAHVRRVKAAALDLAFGCFVEHDWTRHTGRAAAFASYVAREAWWLDDYALFQACAAEWPGVSWRQWPEPIRDRHPEALSAAWTHFERRILREQYAQWIADEQWQEAREALAARGITVVGDLQFVVALESADVWARADEYLLDVSVGAPPDAFSAEGQNWKLPGYRWDVIAASGYELMRVRAHRAAELFDGIRIDHLVGLYRTYNIPEEGHPFFLPGDEHRQVEQGEAVLHAFQQTGALLLAEDLGTVPDFVRASMARLGVAGTKVLRWERRWHEHGQPFIDPRDYPELSVAMTGTHDTETLAGWWDGTPPDERRAVFELPTMRAHGFGDPREPWSDRLRDALLDLAWHARSSELFVLPQDLFGWKVRINVPGIVNASNWTWRLPWPVDRLSREDEPARRADAVRALSSAAGRTHPSA